MVAHLSSGRDASSNATDTRPVNPASNDAYMAMTAYPRDSEPQNLGFTVYSQSATPLSLGSPDDGMPELSPAWENVAPQIRASVASSAAAIPIPTPLSSSDARGPPPLQAMSIASKLARNEQLNEDDWIALLAVPHATWKSALVIAATECNDDVLAKALLTVFNLDEAYGEALLKALTTARRFSVLDRVAAELDRDPWKAMESATRPIPWFEGAWDLIADNLSQTVKLVASRFAHARAVSCTGDLRFSGRLVVSDDDDDDDDDCALVTAMMDATTPVLLFATRAGIHGYAPSPSDESTVGAGILVRPVRIADAVDVRRCEPPMSPLNDVPLGPHAHPVTGAPGWYFLDTARRFDTSAAFTVELLVHPTKAAQRCTLVGDHRFAVGLDVSNASLLPSFSLLAQTLTSSQPIAVNQWTHVCAYASAVGLGLMVNGVVVAQAQRDTEPAASQSAPPPLPPACVWIGASTKAPDNNDKGGVHGSIAEVRLWASVVPAEAVVARSGRALRGAELAQVFAYWPMDQSSSAPVEFLRNASQSGAAAGSKQPHCVLRWTAQHGGVQAGAVALRRSIAPSTRIPITGLGLQCGNGLTLVDCSVANDGTIGARESASFVWPATRVGLKGRSGLVTTIALATPSNGAVRVGVLLHAGSSWELATQFSLDEAGLDAACKSSGPCCLVVVELRRGPAGGASVRVDLASSFRAGARAPTRVGGRVYNVAVERADEGALALQVEFALEDKLVRVAHVSTAAATSALAQLVCDLGAPEHVAVALGLQASEGVCTLQHWHVEATAPPPPPLPPPAATLATTADEAWSCTSCQQTNAQSAVRCGRCTTARNSLLPAPLLRDLQQPFAKRQSISAGTPPVPTRSGGGGGGEPWTCPKCTFFNEAGGNECQMCAAPRAEAKWSCDKCTFLNDAGAAKCTVCDAPKPADGAAQLATAAHALASIGSPPRNDDVFPAFRPRAPAPSSLAAAATTATTSGSDLMAALKRALPKKRAVRGPRLSGTWDSTAAGLGVVVDGDADEEPAWVLAGCVFGLARFSDDDAWAVEWQDGRGLRFDARVATPGEMAGQWHLAGNAMGQFRGDLVADAKEIGAQLPCGLENMVSGLQNVCYQNAVMQALFATDALRQLVLSAKPPQNTRFGIVQRLFATMATTRRPALRALEFQRILRSDLSPGEQMDASDFCNHMFDVLEEQVPELPFRVDVDVVNRCAVCHAERTKTDKELGLNVALPTRFFPIADIKIVSCPADDLSRLPALAEGYERLRTDLNPRRETSFFFCVKRAQDSSDVVTEIVVKHARLGDAMPTAPPGMHFVGGFGMLDSFVNVNEGAGRDRVFVFTKKEKTGSPITEIAVAPAGEVVEGFRKIGTDVNVNGAGGNPDALYLWYRRGMPLTDLVIAPTAPHGRDFVQLDGALPGLVPAVDNVFVHTSDASGRAPLTNFVLMDAVAAEEAVRESGGLRELCSAGYAFAPFGLVLVKERGQGSPIAAVQLVRAPQPRPVAGPDCLELVSDVPNGGWAAVDTAAYPPTIGLAQRFTQQPPSLEHVGGAVIQVSGECTLGGDAVHGVVFAPSSGSAGWTLVAKVVRDAAAATGDLLVAQLTEGGDMHGYFYETAVAAAAGQPPIAKRFAVALRRSQASAAAAVALRPPVVRVSVVDDASAAGRELVLGADGQPVALNATRPGPRLFVAVERSWTEAPLKRVALHIPDVEQLPPGWQCASHDAAQNLSRGSAMPDMFLAWQLCTALEDAVVDVAWTEGLAALPRGFTKVEETAGQQADGDFCAGQNPRGKLSLAVRTAPRASLGDGSVAQPSWLDGVYASVLTGPGPVSGLVLRAVAAPVEGAVVLDMRATNGSSHIKAVWLPGCTRAIGYWASDADVNVRVYCELVDDAPLSGRMVHWQRHAQRGTVRLVRDDFVSLLMTREPAEFWQRGQLVFTNRSRGHDVQNLVTQHLSMQTLDGHERLECDSATCRGVRQVHLQQTRITAPPQHLVVTVKRMGYDARMQRGTKSLVTTGFEPTLRLADVVYSLYAVVVHEGAGASSGHYVAYCKYPSRPQWILFNDAKVSAWSFDAMRQSIERSANRTAYLLFYRRADLMDASVALPDWVRAMGERENVDFVKGDLEARTSRFYRETLRDLACAF